MDNYTFCNATDCVDFLSYNILFCYINTNEIPSELFRENLISLHVKITCCLPIWKYHLCYGYIIIRAFHTKKLLKWNGLVFHWCLYNKENITWPLGDTKFLFSCWKIISLVRCAHSWNIFQQSKRNFVFPRGHVISSIYCRRIVRLVVLDTSTKSKAHSTYSLSKEQLEY